jgi:Bacterial Ig domain/PKD domain
MTRGAGCQNQAGGNLTQQVTLVVNSANHAPTVSNAAADASGNEGSTLTTNGAFSDQDGNGTLTITKQSGAGTVTDNGDGTWSWSHTPNDDGNGTVVVQASDGIAPAVTDSFNWSAGNVAPNVTSPGPQNASEGTPKSFNLGSFADPGNDGPWTGTVDWGDGSPSEPLGPFASPGSLGSKIHTYADNDTYTVTVTITETGSGTPPSGSATFTANVSYVAPTVSLNGPNAADEGQTKTYTYTVTDPGNDPPTISTSCGANGVKSNEVANSFDCTFPDGPASSTVEVTADDGDPTNNIGTDEIAVQVANIAPTANLTGEPNVDEGSTHTYTYTVTDPGQDGFTVDTGYPTCGTGGTVEAGSHVTTASGGSFE